jgi:arylsulfatase A-like enzyme
MTTTEKPNIVYIMADDLGYGDLGCYGATKIPTPNIDKLAEQGMRFTDAHSSSAVCTPSRYSVLTGRYCWRTELKHGVISGYGAPLIEKERLTIANMLKSLGYHTAAIGKWHVGLGWQVKPGAPTIYDYPRQNLRQNLEVDYNLPLTHGPKDLGFDYFFGIAGSLDMTPYCYIENDHSVGIPTGVKSPLYNQQRPGPVAPGWKDEEVDITCTQKAVDFIKEHGKNYPEQPFFLYMTPAAPHRPCDCRPDFVIGKSQAGDRGDMVVLFDWIVGQVIDTLKENNLFENTIIMITSDNGARATCANGKTYGHLSNGHLRGQKADIWEGGHREPFIAVWENHIMPNSTSDSLICLMDVYATLADLLKFKIPETAAEDSISFLLYLGLYSNRDQIKGRESLIHHSSRGVFSIRKGKWKLIDGLGSGGFSFPHSEKSFFWKPKGQLYNIKNDLQESLNFYKAEPKLVNELNEELKKAKINSLQ